MFRLVYILCSNIRFRSEREKLRMWLKISQCARNAVRARMDELINNVRRCGGGFADESSPISPVPVFRIENNPVHFVFEKNSVKNRAGTSAPKHPVHLPPSTSGVASACAPKSLSEVKTKDAEAQTDELVLKIGDNPTKFVLEKTTVKNASNSVPTCLPHLVLSSTLQGVISIASSAQAPQSSAQAPQSSARAPQSSAQALPSSSRTCAAGHSGIRFAPPRFMMERPSPYPHLIAPPPLAVVPLGYVKRRYRKKPPSRFNCKISITSLLLLQQLNKLFSHLRKMSRNN